MKKFNCIHLHAVLIAACLSVCVSTFVRAQLPSYVPSNGLVAWYPFNGNANDESGNGNNGGGTGLECLGCSFVTSPPIATTDRFNSFNSAFQFDNSFDFLDIPNSTSLQLTNLFTISVWLNPNTGVYGQGPSYLSVLQKWGGTGTGASYMIALTAEGFPILYTNNGITTSSLLAGSSITLNSWSLITFTFENGMAKLFINGSYINSSNNLVIPSLQNSSIQIGRNLNQFPQYSGDAFEGKIDDIGIWNRALSPSEIEALYTSTVPCETTVASIEATIIEGETYDFNGQSLTAAGTYESVLTNVAGCDSVVTLTLTVDPSFNCGISSLSSTVCLGDSVTLSVESVTHISIDESVLIGNYGNSVTSQWNNTFETEVGRDYKLVVSGLYTVGTYCPQLVYDPAYQLPGFYGYANPEILDLGGIQDGLYCTALAPNNFVRPTPDVYNPNHIYEYYFTAISNSFNVGFNDCCWGDNCGSVEFSLYELSAGSNFLWSTGETTPTIAVAPTETTTYSVTVTQGNQTCTSDVTITVNQPTAASIEATITDGETYEFNGQSLTTAGTYEAVLTNAAGCDSLVTLMLSVEPAPLNCNVNAASSLVCVGETLDLTVAVSGLSSDNSANNGQYFYSDFETCNLNQFTYSGGSIGITNTSYQGSCAVAMSHFAGQVPNNFYPSNRNFLYGTYKVQAIATAYISDNNMYLFQGDALGGGLSVASLPNNTDNPGLYINGLGINYSNTNINVTQGQWYELKVEVFPTVLNVYINGSLRYTTTSFSTPTAGRFKLGVAYSGNYDNMEFIPYSTIDYAWSTGEATPSISVSPIETTSYSVTVTQGDQSCTSDVTITVNQPSATSIEATITEGETYDFNGQSLTAAGTYESVLTNVAGCDSVVTLTLIVDALPIECDIENSALGSICAGENAELNAIFEGNQLPSCSGIQVIRKVPSEYSTVQSAIDNSNSGDVIILDPGTYAVNNLQMNQKIVHLVSSGNRENTFISGNGTNRLLTINNDTTCLQVIKGISFINGSALSNSGYVTAVQSGKVIFEDCVFSNSGGNTGNTLFRGSGQNTTTFKNCIVRNNNAENYAGLGYATIVGCLIYSNSGWNNSSPVVTSRLVNSVVYGNGGGAGNPWTTGGATNSTVVNSIIWANGGAGQVYSCPSVTYSIIQGGYSGVGNLSLNPLFVNPSSADFSLQSTSPAINAGNSDLNNDGFSYLFDTQDQDPDGTRMDIGALYYTLGPIVNPVENADYNYNGVSYLWSTGENSEAIVVYPTETTTYSVTITQGDETCTSDVTITVNQPSGTSIDATITEGETYEFNGQSLTAAGTYDAVLTNAAGCDSLVTLTLSVEPTLTCEIDASALTVCEGEEVELTVNAAAPNIGAACSLNQLPENLREGLVAWYPFCGNANDASGNENDGVVNGATLVNDRFGNTASAYSFNGTSNNIRISHSNSLTFQNQLSISIWINSPNYSLNNGQVRNAIGKRRTPSLSGWGIETVDGYQTCCGAQFFINNNTGSGGLDYEDSNPMPINQWVHLVGVYNGTTLYLYQNGQLLGSSAGVQNLSSTIEDLFLGSEYANTSYYLGLIDDVSIWNRAITSAEVSQLFNSDIIQTTWSTGETTPSITVAPTETTTYSVTVTQGNQTCTSDVTITVLPNETYYADADGDGFGNFEMPLTTCGDIPTGYTLDNTDCNDGDALNYPFASCDDGDPCTLDDLIQLDCSCAGFFADSDEDGTCDAQDLCQGSQEPGTPCDDFDPCTIDDVIIADCFCLGTFADADGDETCDANDLCAGPEAGAACDDHDDCTIDDIIQGDCTCAGTFADADGDGTCDANDFCEGPEAGSTCDDGNACTTNDTVQSDCSCSGTAVEPDFSSVSVHACEPYTWNNATYSVSGTYDVTLQNTAGCDSIAQLVLTIGAPTTSSESATACGSYTWNGTTYSQSGAYTFVSTNASGCPNTATLNLTINTPSVAPTGVIASQNSVSAGTQVTLTVQGGSLGTGAQWKWYRGACGGSLIGTGSSITITANTTNSYFVRAEGVCNTTDCGSVTVTVQALACGPLSVVASQTTVCVATPTTLTVTGNPGAGGVWKWYKNGCGLGTTIGTGSNVTVLPTTTTTYYVRAEGGSCGITSCMSVTIQVNSAPSRPAYITGPVNGLCNLQGVVYTTPAVSGAASYLWTLPSGATIVSGQGTNSITVNFGGSLGVNSSCGTTSICVRSVNNCGSSTARCVDVSLATAAPGFITGQSIVCRMQTYTYSISPVVGATSYTWSIPSTWQILSGQGTTSITVSVGTSIGEIRVVANNACAASKFARKSVTITSCTAQGMSTFDEALQLNVWPNPASDLVHFTSGETLPDVLEIYDMLGKRLYSGSWVPEFDASSLSSGIYFVRIARGEESAVTRMEIAR